ncbi:protein disabled isoform X2 [Neodiprion lecontei]|uniref:Protein disabled isoform X2 n=1 Tax=Neodiprion lecontei TaxID=441921 RepID=A0ABM3GBJ8_NEOLC|nr:protein disabled isoform X2 [Neodiprion lecontei]
MQTLRKKNSPCKFKNEPTRFLGEGVSFKAKLIGILEVSEARGDRMCQAALADLKMAIRAAGEHKQRIAVQVSIEGLRLRDEKTGRHLAWHSVLRRISMPDCLYHHPVHKISFIAQDMSDSRAFGYIFGSPDTGHRFFGIKTDKAASQVVLAMRDLFQVVFDLKKKEIELAKQHIEQNAIKFRSGIFVEPAPDTKGAAGSEAVAHRIRALNSEAEKPAERKPEVQGGVIADLLDLQFELNSLQQGIHQMDKITPDNPRPPYEDPFETDPFGDSFANMKARETVQPILPPPPSSAKRGHLERQQTLPAVTTSTTSSPATTLASKTPPPQGSVHWFDKETENLFNEGELSSLAMKAAAGNQNSSGDKDRDSASLSVTPTLRKSPQIDVFTELDPLGTGLIKPYVDKKDFFQHLKNPPKKVLKDLVTTTSGDTFPANFNLSQDPLEPIPVQGAPLGSGSEGFEDSNFADFNSFETAEQIVVSKTESPKARRVGSPRALHLQPLSVSLPPEEVPPQKSLNKSESKESTESVQALVRLPSPKKYLQSVRKREFDIDLAGSRGQSMDRPFPVDFTSNNDSPASPLRSGSSDANSRLSSSSAELDIVPEPPPRGAGSILINPPPLPPKKQGGRSTVKPPPRPPHTDGHFHYDFIQRKEASPSPTRKDLRKSPGGKDIRNRFDDDFSPPPPAPPQLPKRSELANAFPTSKFEDSFTTMAPTTLSSLLHSSSSTTTTSVTETKKSKPSLDITLSQLTSTNLGDLANALGMNVTELTSLTLQQLTECLASLTAKEITASDGKEQNEPEVPTKLHPAKQAESSFVVGEPLFTADFDQGIKQTEQNAYDKYAVFRELLELEQQKQDREAGEEEEKRQDLDESEVEVEEADKVQAEEETETSPNRLEDDQKSVECQAKNSVIPKAGLTVDLPPIVKQAPKAEAEDDDLDDTVNGSTEEKEDSKEEDEEPVGQQDKEESRVEDNIGSAKDGTGVEIDKEADSNGVEQPEEPESKEEAKIVMAEKTETKSSSDRYAALREIIEETVEQTTKEDREDQVEETMSGSPSYTAKTELKSTPPSVDLMSLFSKPLTKSLKHPPSSPKKVTDKKEDDLTLVSMEIFEEVLISGGTQKLSSGQAKVGSTSGFEDTFSPFPAAESKPEKDEAKDDANWAKFDSNVFHSDKSSGEGAGSVGGTSPWSPDGKEFQGKDEPPFKPAVNRNSGDSDNEWKDEEESEGSNGRPRDDAFWGSGGKPPPPRHQTGFDDPRGYYDHGSPPPPGPVDKERGFRERPVRKGRGSSWIKGAHRSRDVSPWHEEQCNVGRWEEDHRGLRYSRKIPYKDHPGGEEEPPYKGHWKCRPKQSSKPRPWSGDREGFWAQDHPSYEEERKRRMALWAEEDRDRFSSQESMGYDEDERWARRWSNEYERRRCREEEAGRFWGRRGPEAEYTYTRDPYRHHEAGRCCSRERPRDYAPSGWEDEYGEERGEDSPRYSAARKRVWPKRPNSATESRNAEPGYADPRPKYPVSRSECSDNDSDAYMHRPRRSRSRESYWGSDQEFEGWPERCWSEGPDGPPTKSDTLHRRRINRHKSRAQTKSQGSPFEDDFTQEPDEAASDPFVAAGPESRLTVDVEPQKIPVETAALSPRGVKEHALRREPRSYKRSGYRHSPYEDELTPTASVSSDTSDRQRLGSDLKATPEELPRDTKDPLSADGFVSEDSGRDSFFNGDPRFDDDAFNFKSELDDCVPERATTLPLKSSRQMKCSAGGKIKTDIQYIKKSESVNIFVRESDPFDDDDFFN